MPTFHLNPGGDDAADGLSHDTAWRTLDRLNRYLVESAQPGDRYLLRAGQTFPGAIEVSCQSHVEFGTYDGDARAVILSGPRNGFSDYGSGGLTVRGLKLVGDGRSAEAAAGLMINAAATGIEIEDVEASGYTLGGILLTGELRDVTVRKSYLHHNANGLFVSAPTVRGLRVLDTEASENDLPNPESSGFGMSLNGAEDVEISGCRANRNGRAGSGGQSGLMLYLCRHATIRHTEACDNHDPNPETGDGQGIVIDDSWDVLVECCEAHRNLNGGIQIHDEFQGTSPRNVTVRSCTLEGNAVGLSTQGGAGNLLWEANHVRCSSKDGVYRAAVDVHRAGPGTRFWRNTLEAEDGACLLAAASETGLANTTFGGDDWRSRNPAFVVRGRGYTSLAAALAS